MPEKYEKPEVDFVEMENEDVIVTSTPCDEYMYGDGCTGGVGS